MTLTAWEAFKLSAVIGKRQIFGGIILISVNVLFAMMGIFLFVVGIFLTAAWSFAIAMVAYDELFGNADPR